MKRAPWLFAIVALLPSAAHGGVQRSSFGTFEGKAVEKFALTNKRGARAEIITYGATLVRVDVPDRDGKLGNVVCGFPSLEGYMLNTAFMGATIGRYGNRIAKGTFRIGDKTYSLPINNGPNTLHGGPSGFDKKVWTPRVDAEGDEPSVIFHLESPDGASGFPGTLKVDVRYRLTAANAIEISYEATTDRDTHLSLTNHSYFNLSAGLAKDALDHVLTLKSSEITEVDRDLIPTGKLMLIAGTAFDFRKPRKIGNFIDADDPQIKLGGGYDHNYVLGGVTRFPRLIATVSDPLSGRRMEVLTTEPGVQFYTGNFLSGDEGLEKVKYVKRYAFCLETQHYPDSPNHPQFPSTLLRAGETMRSTTIYKFLVDAR